MAEGEITIKMIVWALTGSFLPALFWLWFWRREDSKNPEPRGLVALTFLGGICSVFLVLPISKAFVTSKLFEGTVLTITMLAIIEEVVKYLVIYAIALKSKHFDEPIDAVVYAITVALGFAAMENFLYIVDELTKNNIVITILNGNMRFIGATLLHTVSSATIGAFIAFSFYKPRLLKIFYTALGLVIASLLHTTFNLLIIKTETLGDILTVFSYLWILVVILILLFEKIKQIYPKITVIGKNYQRK